jgi:hypothetical protein
VLPGGIGSGGDIKIKAGSLVLTDGLLSKTVLRDRETQVIYMLMLTLLISQAVFPILGYQWIITSTGTTTTGSAGNIVIDTQTFQVADGAALSARSQGDGQGGTLQ